MRSLLGFSLVLCGCGGLTPASPAPPPVATEQPSTAVYQPPPDVASAAPVIAETPAPPASPALPEVTFAEMESAPLPGKLPSITLRAPQKNQVVAEAKAALFDVKLDVRGWPLDGGDLCLTLDARPCVRVENPKSPVKLGDLAGDQPLSEGSHVLVAYARRASRESVKGAGKTAPVAIVPFFVGKKGESRWKDGAPLLVFSTPTAASSGDILVDWFVANAELADSRYVVHAMVTGPGLDGRGEVITSWKPWRIAHARPGMYTIRLVLLHYEPVVMDSASATSVKYSARELTGLFADVTRQVRVEAK